MKLTITDDFGNKSTYNFDPNKYSETQNVDNFIFELLKISEEKRKLPCIIQSPNGSEFFPSIKMKFENYGSPLLGDELEAILITWRD